MTVYLEMYSVDYIMKKVKEAENIAIIGCRACVNSSLALSSESGIVQELDESSGQFVMRALLDKMAELEGIFRREGKRVTISHVVKGVLCAFDEDVFHYLRDNKEIAASDTIVSLVCPVGLIGLRKLFPKHRIVPTVGPPLGVFFVERELVDGGRARKMLPKTAKVLRFPGKRDLLRS